MDLQAYLASQRVLVDAALGRLLPTADERPGKLHEAMRYSVLAPGKRLRPLLMIASAEAVGGRAEEVLTAACGLECIHAFSLIHDDLPCMDNDDYRRGRLTSHRVFGDAMALLCGDALLALAFELVCRTAEHVPYERVVAALQLVAQATGTFGMVGGQVVDMESEGQDVDEATLTFIHSRKTGALITAAVVSGALLANGSAEAVSDLRRYGRHVGLAFQIADDILDIVGDEAKLGKPVGSDAKSEKATYPRLMGLDASRRRAAQEVAEAEAALAGFGPEADPLRAMAAYIVERDS